MVVCKFFQQGNCRYGQSCRFDHIYGSKYSYQAPAQQTPQPQAGVTDDQLVNQVLLDVQAALKGGQWILSCYSPYKKSNFPGITDLSMEEARLFIYEAKANNNLDQAVAYMNNFFKEATYKLEQLLQPSPAIIKVLQSLYRGEIVSTPFTNAQGSEFGNVSAASTIFRSAVQGPVFGETTNNNTPSIFNQSPGFGQIQGTNQTPSVFGPSSVDNPKSIFAQANQSVFGPSQPTNAFPTSPDSAKSIFAQATQNAFSQPANPKSIFGEASQSAFGKPNDVFNQQTKDPFNQPNDPFNQPKDPFNQHNPFASSSAFQSSDNKNIMYSDINDLTPEYIEAFQASDFKLGLIPEVPPPHSLCF